MRLAAIVLMAAAAPALAGEKPVYAPVPSWIVPAPAADARPGDGAPDIAIFDQQQRLVDSETWVYLDVANRITSEQALAHAGTINLQWQPDLGDLIVHRIAVIRGSETIDQLGDKPGDHPPLTVLRRERGLEQLQLDGTLTATMAIKDLRVGDVLRVTYSATRRDPVLKGAMQSSAYLIADPVRASFARARILWAGSTVHWKAQTTVAAKLATVGGFRELTVTLPLAKPIEIPGDAPARFHPLPVLELSSFDDWAAVSKVMAPLYQTAGLIKPGSPLAAEVARIKAASPDAKTRTALALRTVQSDVRYLFNGMDHGNYIPQPPETTWAVRYGDCKAKTMLLMTILAGLGIDAEPVLAHTQLGDYLPRRLPSPAAFNHVLVRATIDGASYWLDGTRTGTRLADLGDTPFLHAVLPVRSGGATLMPVPTHANARPDYTIDETIDQSAGIGIVAPFAATVSLRGPLAEQANAAAAQATPEKRRELIDNLIGRLVRPATIVTREVHYDGDSATATIKVTGLTDGDWRRDDQRFEWQIDRSVAQFKFGGDRARPEWRDIPVATGVVATLLRQTRVVLPAGGKGFALDGDQTLDTTIAGEHIVRSVTNTAGTVVLTERVEETGSEIAPAAVAETRARLQLAQSRLLKATAPRDYPPEWTVIRSAAQSGRLKPIEAAYARAIAEATEKAPGYQTRAQFHAGVYDRRAAIADLDQVIATRPTIAAYRERAFLHWQLRADAKALADVRAAYALDPGAPDTIAQLTFYQARMGQQAAALALLDERIAAGGENRARLQATKAEVLAHGGDTDGALAAVDAAVASKPGDAQLLNARCWIKATQGVKLDTALKDCTKAIELGDSPAAALDSRALVYFKLNRLDDARADLDAALDLRPSLAASLYMRGVVRRRQGAAATGDADLDGARFFAPRIDEDYAGYGVKPS